MRKFFLLAPLAALGFLACEQQAAEQAATEEPVVDIAAEEQALNALAEQYEQNFAAKDGAALAGYFTEDAVWIAHDGTRTEGREAIQANYAGMAESPATMSIDIQPERYTIAASGDVAHEIGRATVTSTMPDGQTTTETTQYIVLFRKGDDGQWKLTGGMDTAPLAPEGEAAAP